MSKKIPFMKLRQAPPLDWREPYPLWNRIAIETHSKCNRSCKFCPVSTGRRDFSARSMSVKLYESICYQLASLSWEGFVEFFVLNEPLLDPDLLERAEILRAATPKSTIYVSTNGDVLAGQSSPLGYLERLFTSGINSVNLNVYDSGTAGETRLAFYRRLIAAAVRRGLCREDPNKYRRKPPTRNFIHVSDMRTDRSRAEFYDVFFDKTAEDRSHEGSDAHCARPHRHLVVLWDGKVPLCCAMDPTDPDGTYVGDASGQSLESVWGGEAMVKHRYFLQDKGGRAVMRQCRGCSHRMAYPHCVRLTEAPEAIVARWRREES